MHRAGVRCNAVSSRLLVDIGSSITDSCTICFAKNILVSSAIEWLSMRGLLSAENASDLGYISCDLDFKGFGILENFIATNIF